MAIFGVIFAYCIQGRLQRGKWTQLASNLAQGGKFPPPDDIFVVCNCASFRCMEYLILYNYDVASAVVSITGNS